MTSLSFAKRLTDLAAEAPDRAAITCGAVSVTRAQLESSANRLARDLAGGGAGKDDMITIALSNSVDWFVAFAAAWKIGAIPQPVSSRLPAPELEAIVALAEPKVVIGVDEGTFDGIRCLPIGYRPSEDLDDGPLPDAVSPAWKAPTSGGSTGRPKLIVSGDPSVMDPDGIVPLQITPGGCMVMPGPLYHNGPLIWSCQALLWGDHVVVLPRFDAEGTLAAIEQHGADIVYLVPTMMKRIWRLPDEVREGYDLSSLQVVWHLAEPCPDWLKQVWLDWLGPERIVELYGGTEGQASTVITGQQWLAHRGSVGRSAAGEIMITDPEGEPLPAGEMGEVWLRSTRDTPTYRYLGAEARTREGGWESLGDMGRVDAEGYLYLGDRMQDMILTGGSNVYPAEVEAALQEHPLVRSCCVIGLPDDDLGQRIHAIVEADADQVSVEELLRFMGERLVRYKVPRSVELVQEVLRDDAGKVRRSQLRSERLPDAAAAGGGGSPGAA
ncbi:MAG: AMP-binding protein [Acidimicrobiia bacterium]|nr:AMP-binding protein [Acidimicrobiia bacterium]